MIKKKHNKKSFAIILQNSTFISLKSEQNISVLVQICQIPEIRLVKHSNINGEAFKYQRRSIQISTEKHSNINGEAFKYQRRSVD
jgi:hypothetical protein